MSESRKAQGSSNLEFVETPLLGELAKLFMNGVDQRGFVTELLVFWIGLPGRGCRSDRESERSSEWLRSSPLGHHQGDYVIAIRLSANAYLWGKE